MTVEQAQGLFRQWKGDEWGQLRILIIRIAALRGEFHADYMVDRVLTERNMIGGAVNALVKQGYLISTGEHRKSRSKVAHGRRSYVYALTQRGEQLARVIPDGPVPLPQRYEQPGLF